MKINIIGEHLSVTEAISNYIENKFKHIPIPDKLLHVEFRISTDKLSQHVHFHARHHKEDFIIKTKDKDLYAAIDIAMDKIKRSFVKFKEKHEHAEHIHKVNSLSA